MASLLRERAITLSPVAAFTERSKIWTWWKVSNQDHKSGHFLGRKRQRSPGAA